MAMRPTAALPARADRIVAGAYDELSKQYGVVGIKLERRYRAIALKPEIGRTTPDRTT